MSHTSFHGNLGSDPVDRTGNSNTKRVTFSVAVQTGNKDKGTEKTNWIDVTAFGSLAENILASLRKGMHVFVSGRFDAYSQTFYDQQGQEKNVGRLSIIADQCGPDLRFQTAVVTKASSGGSRAEAQPAAVPAGAGAGSGNADFF